MNDWVSKASESSGIRSKIGASVVVASIFFSSLFLFAGPASAAVHPLFSLRVAHSTDACQSDAPTTFGQPFRAGDVPRGETVEIRSGDTAIPTQVDVKARNSDGSIRHAIISARLPCDLDREQSLSMVARDESNPASQAIELSDIGDSAFDSRVALESEGQNWTLNADDLIRRVNSAGGCSQTSLYCRHRLNGPLAGEWVIGAPPNNSQGEPHPHLMVFFAIRAYGPAPIQSVRVDTTIENDWAYVDNPQNVDYAATLSVEGQPDKTYKTLTHYRQARWHHVAWWGQHTTAPWFVALNSRYLQATPALPSYEDTQLSGAMLSKVRQQCAPMKSCNVNKRMESAGAQAQIGPLPQWSSAYVVAPTDYHAFRWMLANSDALGAYDAHYRSQETGEPLSVDRHPCATLLGAAELSKCKVPPHADDRFPDCDKHCGSPLQAEPAHHGAPAYVAYLVTGDWYYEQELTFWAQWDVFFGNPAYRKFRAGLVKSAQIRSQAWQLRTLGFAAYILPDASPSKKYLNSVVASNIEWYNQHYTDDPQANPLGFLKNGYAVIYPASGSHHDTGVSTWQMSFFTWSAGNLADLGFAGADRMRNYFSRFQLGPLTTPEFCPELASGYYLRVRDKPGSPYYSSFGEVYEKTFPKLVSAGCEPEKLKQALRKKSRYEHFDYPPGTMVGYPASGTGFVANFQIGLAAAARSDDPEAAKAWDWFTRRPIRPDYSEAPQFSIVPSPR